MIQTLTITILLEGAAGLGYCRWRSKPILPVLLTSIFANVITQSLLWIALDIFFRHYLIALFVAEVFIWLIESILLYLIAANRLNFGEAAELSLFMNLVSFAFGWFLAM